MFGEDERLIITLEKDECEELAQRNRSTIGVEALKEIYKRIRPGEPPLVESAQMLINNFFFDPRRYDIAPVGRYKFDKKLALAPRIRNRRLARGVISPLTGELLCEAGQVITSQMADVIEQNAVNEVHILLDNGDMVKVFSNNTVDPYYILGFDLKDCGINEKVKTPVLLEYLRPRAATAKNQAMARERIALCLNITKDDIFASIGYLLGLAYDIRQVDDIDHLETAACSVGEQLRTRCVSDFQGWKNHKRADDHPVIAGKTRRLRRSRLST